MGISAATGERVKELMQRVRKVVESLPQQSDFELFTEEEERVSFEEQTSDKFEVIPLSLLTYYTIINYKFKKLMKKHTDDRLPHLSHHNPPSHADIFYYINTPICLGVHGRAVPWPVPSGRRQDREGGADDELGLL